MCLEVIFMFDAIIVVVQLDPDLKSKTKALDQRRTLNSLWTHPPTYRNFLKGSRLLPTELNFSNVIAIVRS